MQNNNREVTERSSLLGSQQQIEIVPQQINDITTGKTLFSHLAGTTVAIEETIKTTFSVHHLPLNRYTGVLMPILLAGTLTIIKSFAFSAMRYAQRINLNAEERAFIEKRLNKIFDVVNRLDEAVGNFVIAYIFAIWVLGYFFPGTHWDPTAQLLSLYYVCCLGASILFSTAKTLFSFDKVSKFFNKITNNYVSGAVQSMDYALTAHLNSFASIGIIPQCAEIGLLVLQKDEEVDDPLHQKDFTFFYIRAAVSGVVALLTVTRLIYEFATKQDHKISDKIMSGLAKIVMFGFITLLMDNLGHAIKEKDYFTCAAYVGLALLVPILLLLNKVSLFQKIAFHTLKPSTASLASSRYHYTLDPQSTHSSDETHSRDVEVGTVRQLPSNSLPNMTRNLEKIFQDPTRGGSEQELSTPELS